MGTDTRRGRSSRHCRNRGCLDGYIALRMMVHVMSDRPTFASSAYAEAEHEYGRNGGEIEIRVRKVARMIRWKSVGLGWFVGRLCSDAAWRRSMRGKGLQNRK